MSKDSNIPGWPDQNPFTSSLAGGMDFMKNFWGKSPAAIPGFVVPTVDLAEIEKRIKDLKAVESWLEVNAGMLRASIQALEVQHNTIATLHALGKSFTSVSDAGNTQEASNHEARHATPLNKHGLPQGWPEVAPVSDAAASLTEGNAPPPPQATTPQTPAEPVEPAAAMATATLPTAATMSTNAWLGFLHDQFNKVAMSALAPVAPENMKTAAHAEPVMAAKKMARPKSKTVAKKTVAIKTARPAKARARKS